MGRSAKPQCVRTTRPHPATTTEKVSFSGSTYELDLCEEHADALYRDLFGWARLGREVTSVERARKTEAERGSKVVFPMARRVEEVQEEPKPKIRTVVSALPAKAESWRLSSHAQERCQQRSITREQTLWAAIEPGIDRPNPYGDGDIIRLRTRGTIVAVVNSEDHIVLTVWDSSAPKSEQDTELEYAAAHSTAA